MSFSNASTHDIDFFKVIDNICFELKRDKLRPDSEKILIQKR